jgi:F0F1-type ATP synthase epsilon subunit
MKTFLFQLQTPQNNLLSEDVVQINTTAADGILSVMADFQPFVTVIEIAILKVTYENGKTKRFVVNGGVLSVRENKVTLDTIEAQEIPEKTQDLDIFPQALAAKNSDVQKAIEEALAAGGYYTPDVLNLSLLSEERLAKAEILKELAREGGL